MIVVERNISLLRLLKGGRMVMWEVREAGKATQYKTTKELATAYAEALRVARSKGRC